MGHLRSGISTRELQSSPTHRRTASRITLTQWAKGQGSYRTLPLPLIHIGLALIFSILTLAILGLVVVTAVIGFAHGLRRSAANPIFWLLIFLMIGWLSAIGFFILYFGSGAAVPISELPEIMQNVLEWNPLKQWFEALSNIYTNQPVTNALIAKQFIALPISAISIAGGLLLWRKR